MTITLPQHQYRVFHFCPFGAGLREHQNKGLDMYIQKFVDMGYFPVRRLPSGTVIGIRKQMFTVGLFVGLSESRYERRYCYEHMDDAFLAFTDWDGNGDPPGPWVKEKPSDRLGPGATK